MTISTTIVNEKPIEERFYESRTGNFAFKKSQYNIPLPQMLPYWIKDHKRYLITLASKLDKTLDKFYELLGEDNIYIRPGTASGRYGTVRMHYCNASHIDFLKENYNENFINSYEKMHHYTPRIVAIDYESDKEITIDFQKGVFQDFTEPLLGVKLYRTLQVDELDTIIKNIIVAIDNLFIEQGIEPTHTNRHNLISLVVGIQRNILLTPEIQKLTGANQKTHTIDNPNLIHLASQGVNDKLLRMFYAYKIYPESVEEMLELVDIPIEMLYAIWNGKR